MTGAHLFAAHAVQRLVNAGSPLLFWETVGVQEGDDFTNSETAAAMARTTVSLSRAI
jgi:hypothetical protein